MCFRPELIVYNDGPDILDGDPRGELKVSLDEVSSRDEKVFRFAKEMNIPLVMLTSGMNKNRLQLQISPFLMKMMMLLTMNDVVILSHCQESDFLILSLCFRSSRIQAWMISS